MSYSDLVIVCAAVLGVAFLYERFRHPERETGWPLRWGMAVFVGLDAWAGSHTFRGFLYLLLMPIGAYKLAQVIVEPWIVPIALARFSRARAAD